MVGGVSRSPYGHDDSEVVEDVFVGEEAALIGFPVELLAEWSFSHLQPDFKQAVAAILQKGPKIVLIR